MDYFKAEKKFSLLYNYLEIHFLSFQVQIQIKAQVQVQVEVLVYLHCSYAEHVLTSELFTFLKTIL